MNKIESEVIEIAIASIIANRTKASHGDPRQDIFGEDPTVKDFENDPVVKAAAEVALKWIEKAFNDAYIIGVHDGSIAEKKHNYNNIGPNYSKENWLKENGLTPTEPGISKEETTEPIIGSNGITDPPNETQKV